MIPGLFFWPSVTVIRGFSQFQVIFPTSGENTSMMLPKGASLTILLIVSTFFCRSVYAVSLIAGIPNAEVTEKGAVIVAHESQFAVAQSEKPWNSFTFFTYGLTKHWELASSLFNLTSPASDRIALSVGFKAVYEVSYQSEVLRELKFTGGSEIPFALQGSEGVGVWIFGAFSFRIAPTLTRITFGPSYGTRQIFGKNILSAMIGLEQPIVHRISLVSDWFSGSHDLGALILAVQYDPTSHLTVITGPKFSNDLTLSANAWMIEITAKI